MTSPVKARRYLICAVLLGSAAFRLPGCLVAPPQRVYNVDELELLGSVLGLFAGQTPTALQWPAGIHLFLLLPVIFASFILESRTGFEALLALDSAGLMDALVVYLGTAWNAPSPSLVVCRTVMGLVECAVLASVMAAAWRAVGGMAAAALGSILVTAPLLVGLAVVLKPDALAAALGTLSVVLVLQSRADGGRTQWVVTMGSAVALGAAISCRFTYFPYVPVLSVAAACSSDSTAGLWHRLGVGCRYVAVTAATVCFFVPQVWVAPIVVAKSLAGNLLIIASSGASTPVVDRLTFVASLMGLPGLLLAVAAVDWRGHPARRRAVLVAVALVAVVGLPLARANHVEARYFLVLLPAAAVLAALGAAVVAGRVQNLVGRCAAAAAVIVLAPVLVWNAGAVALNYRAVWTDDSTAVVLDWVGHEAVGTVALPARFRGLAPMDDESIQRVLGRYAAGGVSWQQRFAALSADVGKGVGDTSYPEFFAEAAFAEDEALDLFKYRCMAYALRRAGQEKNAQDIIFYGRNPDKNDCIGLVDLQALIEQGEVALVVHTSAEYFPGRALRQFGPWIVTEVEPEPIGE